MEFPVYVFFLKQKQLAAGMLHKPTAHPGQATIWLSVWLGVEKKAYPWTFFQ